MSILADTIAEWKKLGFHYDRDDLSKQWVISGSRDELHLFGKILKDFATDPSNSTEFEHDHYGPYIFLKIIGRAWV